MPQPAVISDSPRAAVDRDAFPGRQLEEWIIETIDDHRRGTTEADVFRALDRFAAAPKADGASPRRGGVTRSTSATEGWARFHLARGRGITVAMLVDQALIREDDLAELAGDLTALVEAGHRRLVLDFAHVERLSVWAVASIAAAVRRCVAEPGGFVKVSGLKPTVASVFAVAGVDLPVLVCPDVADAINGAWPDLPDLHPLPVSILAALLRAADVRPTRPAESPAMPTRSLSASAASAADIRLIVQDGPMAGRALAVRGPQFLIGRGPNCQLRLGSSSVSRSHAAIEQRSGRLYLRDLASTNGTLVNGQAVRDREVEVRHGDTIQVGPVPFALAATFAVTPTTSAATAPHWTPPAADEYALADDPTATREGFDIAPGDLEDPFGRWLAEVVEGVLVVTPTVATLDDEADVEVLRDTLLEFLGRKLPRRVVIDLEHVGHLSSRAIGVLVAHHLRLDRAGGALRVARTNPRVAAVLDQVKLGMLINCHATTDDAVIAAWPSKG